MELLRAAVGPEPAVWIGHSFGGRLAFEVAARHPTLVERLVLLDPAILIDPAVSLLVAEDGRRDRSYASFEEGLERRFSESVLHEAPRALVEADLRGFLVADDTDGRWRYRYSQAAVVAAYGEMASSPPPFTDVSVPTLLVLGRESYVTYDHLLDAHRAAAGDMLQVHRCPRRPHGALGRTRRDRRGDRRVSAHLTAQSAGRPSRPLTPRTRRRSRARRRGLTTPSSASSRVTVRGGTTMITFQCVIR